MGRMQDIIAKALNTPEGEGVIPDDWPLIGTKEKWEAKPGDEAFWGNKLDDKYLEWESEHPGMLGFFTQRGSRYFGKDFASFDDKYATRHMNPEQAEKFTEGRKWAAGLDAVNDIVMAAGLGKARIGAQRAAMSNEMNLSLTESMYGRQLIPKGTGGRRLYPTDPALKAEIDKEAKRKTDYYKNLPIYSDRTDPVFGRGIASKSGPTEIGYQRGIVSHPYAEAFARMNVPIYDKHGNSILKMGEIDKRTGKERASFEHPTNYFKDVSKNHPLGQIFLPRLYSNRPSYGLLRTGENEYVPRTGYPDMDVIYQVLFRNPRFLDEWNNEVTAYHELRHFGGYWEQEEVREKAYQKGLRDFATNEAVPEVPSKVIEDAKMARNVLNLGTIKGVPLTSKQREYFQRLKSKPNSEIIYAARQRNMFENMVIKGYRTYSRIGNKPYSQKQLDYFNSQVTKWDQYRTQLEINLHGYDLAAKNFAWRARNKVPSYVQSNTNPIELDADYRALQESGIFDKFPLLKKQFDVVRRWYMSEYQKRGKFWGNEGEPPNITTWQVEKLLRKHNLYVEPENPKIKLKFNPNMKEEE